MRFDLLRLRAIGPFRDTVELPLSELPEGIVAVVGDVGAGKTTLIESMAAALYRHLPNASRGKLSSMAVAKDACVEVQLQYGSQRLRVVHAIDAVSGGWEASLFSASQMGTHGTLRNGVSKSSLTGSTKVRDLDRWIAEHLPPQEVFLASQFSAQGVNKLIDSSDGERKSILLRVLESTKYESMAKEARDRAASAKVEVAKLTARIEDERARGGDIDQAVAVLGEQTNRLESARHRLSEVSRALEAAQEAAKEHELAQQAYVAAVGERERLESELRDAQDQLARLEERIRNNQTLLGKGDEIRVAVTRSAEVRDQIAGLEKTRARLTAEADALARELKSLGRQAEQASAAALEATRRARQAKVRLEQRPAVEAAQASLERLAASFDVAKREVAAAEEELERLQGQRVADAKVRIIGLRGGHEAIVVNEQDRLFDPVALARGALADDDEAVELARALPAQTEAAQARLHRSREGAANASDALVRAQGIAAAAPQVEAAREDLEAAERDEKLAQQRREDLNVARRHAEDQQKDNRAAVDDTAYQLYILDEELGKLDPLTQRAELLAGAQGRIDGHLSAAEQVRATIARLTQELSDRPASVSHPPPAPDLSRLRSAVAAAEGEVQQATGAVAAAQQRLELAQASQARVTELESELQRHSDALSDWSRLGEDLGRNGLQAMEVDAAGPELTATVNNLLHSCLGPKFTLEIQTTRLDAKGKKELEALPIICVNSETGYEGDVRTLSGGERALVGEALQLALTVLVCTRNGLAQDTTLIRDEPTGALEPEDVEAYIAMMRRASAIVKAKHVLVVSHQPRVAELADVRVRVASGAISIEQ